MHSLKLNQLYIIISFAIFATIAIYYHHSQHTIRYKNIPPLTIVIIVDQLSWNQLNQAKSFLKYGLKTITTGGLQYDNCHMPHAFPTTAPGHVAINLGSLPCEHGIVGNKWINESSNKVKCDDDSNYPEFTNMGLVKQNYMGKSPLRIEGLGLSESFALSSANKSNFHVYSVSGKSRGAICTANKLGKALWFDEQEGGFISSSYYFSTLPEWIINWNKEHALTHMNSYTWIPQYPLDTQPYQFPFHTNYEFTAPKKSFINTTYPLDTHNSFRLSKVNHTKAKFSYLQRTPFMNEYILTFAQKLIEETIIKHQNDHLLLWLSLSSLDKVGHIMGPSSDETFDIIYHLDKDLETFMQWIDRHIGLEHTLFVLTSDHGSSDIPEIAAKKGIPHAQRILKSKLIATLNAHIFETYHIQNGIVAILNGQIHLSSIIKNSPQVQAIEQTIVSWLKQQPYIAHAWTAEEVMHTCDHNSTIGHFKNQYFAGRSGSIFLQTKPHVLISSYNDGTSHDSVYTNDTHIPLIFYQKGRFQPTHIYDYVTAQQLPNTLSMLLHIPQVSLGRKNILPRIYEN